MKKLTFLPIFLVLIVNISLGQTDTISYNIYGFEGRLGLGIATPLSNIHISDYHPEIRMNTSLISHTESLGKGRLELQGDYNDAGYLLVTSLDRFGDESEDLIVQLFHPNIPSNKYGILESWHGAGLVISSSGDGDQNPLIFAMNRNEIARFNPLGNLGLGTEEPASKLHIAHGDIYISDIEYGIIMKSPDGQCWKGTLDNYGTLQFHLITCPDFTVNVLEPKPNTSSINVYPNPANNNITVEIQDGIYTNKMKLRIVDYNGRIIMSQRINSSNFSLNISHFAPGAYILNIIDRRGNFVDSFKLVIQ